MSAETSIVSRNTPTLSTIRISGKGLGSLALESFCPACFWLEHTTPDGGPSMRFPGIFSSIDSLSKNVVHTLIDAINAGEAKRPKWLTDIESRVGDTVVGYMTGITLRKFQFVDPEQRIHLTGIPDDILLLKSGNYIIVDYKTARFTTSQDKLLPQYEIQLNAYALIAKALTPGLFTGECRGLSLIYFEPQTKEPTDWAHRTEDGFLMGFKGNAHHIAMDPESVRKLYPKFRRIFESMTMPKGRKDCDDCAALKRVIARGGTALASLPKSPSRRLKAGDGNQQRLDLGPT